jgi:tripartite-type tricarboxylate transporter receptor subunit TctC
LIKSIRPHRSIHPAGLRGERVVRHGAPRNTPTAVIEKLNKEINAALDDPKMKARLADLGDTPLPGSPADFGTLIADETEKWGKVVKFADMKPE